jgi:hypothetical protein
VAIAVCPLHGCIFGLKRILDSRGAQLDDRAPEPLGRETLDGAQSRLLCQDRDNAGCLDGAEFAAQHFHRRLLQCPKRASSDLGDEDIGEVHELHRVSRMRAAAFVGHEEIGFNALRGEELDGDTANVGGLVGERTGLPVRKAAGDPIAKRRSQFVRLRKRAMLERSGYRFEDPQRAEGAERLLLMLTAVDASVQMSVATGCDRRLLRLDFLDENGDNLCVFGLVDPACAAFCFVGGVVGHARPPSRFAAMEMRPGLR